MNNKLFIYPTEQCIKEFKNNGINDLKVWVYFHSVYKKYYEYLDTQNLNYAQHNLFSTGNNALFYSHLEDKANKIYLQNLSKWLKVIENLYSNENVIIKYFGVKTKIPCDVNKQGKRLLSILFIVSYEPKDTLDELTKQIHILIPIGYANYH